MKDELPREGNMRVAASVLQALNGPGRVAVDRVELGEDEKVFLPA